MSVAAGGPRREDTTFRAVRRGAVWAVTKENVFYGDYLSRDQAIRSACYGARAVEAKGRQARVLIGNEVVAHRDLTVAP